MRITINLPDKYGDVLSLTAIGTEQEDSHTACTCVRSAAIDIRDRDGQECVIPEIGRESWKEPTGDLIRRDEVMSIINRHEQDIEHGGYFAYSEIFDEIDSLNGCDAIPIEDGRCKVCGKKNF